MLTTNKLKESIVAWANTQLATGRETCAILDELHRDFGLTDREIREELGLEHLYPKDEPNETEPPAPVYDYEFLYRQTWSGIFHVYAHNDKEAFEMFERELPNIDSCQLDQLDDDTYELLTVT